MYVLGVELACIACLDNGGGVLKHLGPLEAAPEDLASKGARRGGVATFAGVYAFDEHSAFLRGTHLSAIPFGRLQYRSASRMKYDFSWRATRSASASSSGRVPFKR